MAKNPLVLTQRSLPHALFSGKRVRRGLVMAIPLEPTESTAVWCATGMSRPL